MARERAPRDVGPLPLWVGSLVGPAHAEQPSGALRSQPQALPWVPRAQTRRGARRRRSRRHRDVLLLARHGQAPIRGLRHIRYGRRANVLFS